MSELVKKAGLPTQTITKI